MGVSQNQGYHFRDPHNKNYNNLASMLGSPDIGKLPHWGIVGIMEKRMETTGMIGDYMGVSM